MVRLKQGSVYMLSMCCGKDRRCRLHLIWWLGWGLRKDLALYYFQELSAPNGTLEAQRIFLYRSENLSYWSLEIISTKIDPHFVGGHTRGHGEIEESSPRMQCHLQTRHYIRPYYGRFLSQTLPRHHVSPFCWSLYPPILEICQDKAGPE